MLLMLLLMITTALEPSQGIPLFMDLLQDEMLPRTHMPSPLCRAVFNYYDPYGKDQPIRGSNLYKWMSLVKNSDQAEAMRALQDLKNNLPHPGPAQKRQQNESSGTTKNTKSGIGSNRPALNNPVKTSAQPRKKKTDMPLRPILTGCVYKACAELMLRNLACHTLTVGLQQSYDVSSRRRDQLKSLFTFATG